MALHTFVRSLLPTRQEAVLALSWLPDGQLLTTRRDRAAAGWSIEGDLISRHPAIPDCTPTAIVHAASMVLVGDSRGVIRRLPRPDEDILRTA